MSAAVLVALLASLLFAAANNLQRRAAAADRHADAGPIRLMWRLLTTRRWLAGQLVAAVGFLLHAWALNSGGVILVQSIIATTLVYAIIIEAGVERRWLRAQEVLGSFVVVSGVALVVAVGRPAASGEFRSLGRACVVLVVAVIIGAVALRVSLQRPRGRRTAIVLGSAAGACFALDAVFLRAIAGSLSPLDLPVLATNGVGFVVASVLGNIVLARAFQSAPLRHVMPGLAAAEPITAITAGRLAFGETFAQGTAAHLAVALGFVMLLVGVVICALGRAYHRESIPG